MAANFDLSALALKAVCPSNDILYDDKGLPSIMVKIPKMTYAQLGLGTSTATHPAFIVNGSEVDAIWISKYQNIIQNGRAYSLPGQDPANNLNLASAWDACTAKGAGWHLMTRAERAMLALWCKNNGFMPKGNNNYGKDTSESNYIAIPTYYTSNGIGRVATGTGPLTWSHDGTVSGIWDLNGNVVEWCAGLRTVYGELQVLPNNNAADLNNPITAASTLWMAIDGTSGELITPQGDGRTPDSVKVSWDGSKWTYTTNTPDTDNTYHTVPLESIVCDSTIDDTAKLVLQALGLFKYDATSGAYLSDAITFNAYESERVFACGGTWTYGASAGVFNCYGNHARSNAHASIGFRSAFVNLPTA